MKGSKCQELATSIHWRIWEEEGIYCRGRDSEPRQSRLNKLEGKAKPRSQKFQLPVGSVSVHVPLQTRGSPSPLLIKTAGSHPTF